jgi:GNAT superfamily N-acetyltransferase
MHSRADTRTVILGAFDDGRIRGACQVQLPLLDNTHAGYADVFVHPDRQRRGIGRRLVDAACAVASEDGRRILIVEAYAPPDGTSPAREFARALGVEEALEDRMKAVDLVATEPTWAAIGKEIAADHREYRLVTWHDAVPDELLDGYCALNEAFNDQAPLGGLELEAEKWDATRVREREARLLRGLTRQVGTVALAPSGEAVGATEVLVTEPTSWRGMQSGTLVLPAHRGHRLGLALKLANHRAIRKRFPECRTLYTGNAGVNEAMSAVNDKLGYRYVERCVEVQKRL